MAGQSGRWGKIRQRAASLPWPGDALRQDRTFGRWSRRARLLFASGSVNVVVGPVVSRRRWLLPFQGAVDALDEREDTWHSAALILFGIDQPGGPTYLWPNQRGDGT